MRQVAGDKTAAKNPKPTGKNDKGPKKAPAKNEKADTSFEAKRKDRMRREQVADDTEANKKRRDSVLSNGSKLPISDALEGA
jgi:hypothetical protein